MRSLHAQLNRGGERRRENNPSGECDDPDECEKSGEVTTTRRVDRGIHHQDGEPDPQPTVQRERHRDDREDQHEGHCEALPATFTSSPSQNKERQEKTEVVPPGIRVGKGRLGTRLFVPEEVALGGQRRVNEGVEEARPLAPGRMNSMGEGNWNEGSRTPNRPPPATNRNAIASHRTTVMPGSTRDEKLSG